MNFISFDDKPVLSAQVYLQLTIMMLPCQVVTYNTHLIYFVLYTVFRKKNTHSRFVLYLRGKCSDFPTKFSEMFRRKQAFYM